MVFTVNVNNTFIVITSFTQSGRLLFSSRLHTDLLKTSDDYALELRTLLDFHQIDPQTTQAVVLSCVVPLLQPVIKEALGLLTPARIFTVGPGLRTGLQIYTDDPAQLGGELVACAVGALNLYPPPLLLLLMDTAITLVAVNDKAQVTGCAIMPGLKISLEGLCKNTAYLAQTDISSAPSSVIGTNTAQSMQSGIVLGSVCMMDGMLTRFAQALDCKPQIVATGSMASVLLSHSVHSIKYEEFLVAHGLYQIYLRNKQ